MSEFAGLDEEIVKDEKVAENVERIDTAKPKRRPFHYWKIGDKEIKLKLTAAMITKVEGKFRNKNILSLVTDDNIPPLSTMLTIVQAAAIPWNHGTSYADIQSLYDKWTELENGNMTDFLSKVVMPTLAVSGFFTEETSKEIFSELDDQTRLG